MHRRVGAAVAVVSLTLAAGASALAAPAAAAPRTTFQQASSVTAVAVQSVNEQDPPPITGIDKPFSAYTAYVDGDLDSTGVSDARAAIATPGSGVEQGINELEGVGGCTSCPAFDNPLEVYATYPGSTGVQQSQTAPRTVGPLVTTAGSATAAAAAATNSATATTTGGGLLSGTTAALSLGAMTSSLTQSLTDDGLVVTATSSVSHITLAGLVTVDGVTATATQTLRDGAVVARDATIRIGGVTALGQPATIDGDGVHVVSAGDGGAALTALNSTLSAALAAMHLTITAGGVDRSAAGSGGRASANALVVSYDQTVPQQVTSAIPVLPGLPSQVPVGPPALPASYTGTVVLGSAGTVTGAVSVPDFAVTLPGDALPPVSAPDGGTAGLPSRTVFLPGTAGGGGSSSGGPGAGNLVVSRGFGTALQDWSLRAPYLVLVLLALMTLVGVCRGAYRRLHAEEDM